MPRLAVLVLALAIAPPVAARMYQWIDPETGTTQMSGEPPSWYRSAASGPRVLVFEGNRLVDDTAVEKSRDQRRALREKALQEIAERRRKEAERLAAEAAAREEQRMLDRQAGQETTPEVERIKARLREQEYADSLKAIIAEWDKRNPEAAKIAREMAEAYQRDREQGGGAQEPAGRQP